MKKTSHNTRAELRDAEALARYTDALISNSLEALPADIRKRIEQSPELLEEVYMLYTINKHGQLNRQGPPVPPQGRTMGLSGNWAKFIFMAAAVALITLGIGFFLSNYTDKPAIEVKQAVRDDTGGKHNPGMKEDITHAMPARQKPGDEPAPATENRTTNAQEVEKGAPQAEKHKPQNEPAPAPEPAPKPAPAAQQEEKPQEATAQAFRPYQPYEKLMNTQMRGDEDAKLIVEFPKVGDSLSAKQFHISWQTPAKDPLLLVIEDNEGNVVFQDTQAKGFDGKIEAGAGLYYWKLLDLETANMLHIGKFYLIGGNVSSQ